MCTAIHYKFWSLHGESTLKSLLRWPKTPLGTVMYSNRKNPYSGDPTCQKSYHTSDKLYHTSHEEENPSWDLKFLELVLYVSFDDSDDKRLPRNIQILWRFSQNVPILRTWWKGLKKIGSYLTKCTCNELEHLLFKRWLPQCIAMHCNDDVNDGDDDDVMRIVHW